MEFSPAHHAEMEEGSMGEGCSSQMSEKDGKEANNVRVVCMRFHIILRKDG